MTTTEVPLWRPLETGDHDRLREMLHRSSPTSVFRRFFTLLPRDDDLVLRPIVDVDHDRHEELVAVAGGEIVALAGYFRSAADPAEADVAVIVEDGWQGHGIGRELFGALGKMAWHRGITRFSGTILAENAPALQFLRALATDLTLERHGAEVQFTVPLDRPMRPRAHAA
jgi:GNAT superfamily N-acetyltransferase